MSVSCSAYVFYGRVFNRSAIERNSKARGCSHPAVAGANFCPVCGAPMWKAQVADRMDQAYRAGEAGYMDLNDESKVAIGVCLAKVGDLLEGRSETRDVPAVTQEAKDQFERLAKEWNLDLGSHEPRVFLFGNAG